MNQPAEHLTIIQLAEAVQKLLEQYGLLNQQDRRISATPDARTIRYYTTLGLLEPPRTISRQAYYKPRHVLQLATIKALQAKSLSLADIQARLLGRTDQELEALLAAIAAEKQSQPLLWQPVIWRELTLAPGLKLLADVDWIPDSEQEGLVARFQQALNYLAEEYQRRMKTR